MNQNLIENGIDNAMSIPLKILKEKAILSSEKAEFFKQEAARALRLILMEPDRGHEAYFIKIMIDATLSELDAQFASAASGDMATSTQEQLP